MSVDELRAELDALIERRRELTPMLDDARDKLDGAEAAAAENRREARTRQALGELTADELSGEEKALDDRLAALRDEVGRLDDAREGIGDRILAKADEIAAEIEGMAAAPRHEAASALATARAALAVAETRYNAADAAYREAVEDGREVFDDAREAIGLHDQEQRTRARAFINAAVRAAQAGASRETALYEGGLRGEVRTRRDREALERELGSAYAARDERLAAPEGVTS